VNTAQLSRETDVRPPLWPPNPMGHPLPTASAMRRQTRDCPYCSGLLAHRKSDSRPVWDTVLLSSDRFVVTPTLGSLVQGWLLVVTTQHVPCMAALDDEALSELDAVLAQLSLRATSAYGVAPTLFEHGPSGPGHPLGCTVDHAHLHMVPLPFSLSRAAERYPALRFRGEPAHGLAALQALHRRGQGYLYVREPAAPGLVMSPVPGPRQYFRRVIAAELGVSGEYDWRCHPHIANAAATVAWWSNTDGDPSGGGSG